MSPKILRKTAGKKISVPEFHLLSHKNNRSTSNLNLYLRNSETDLVNNFKMNFFGFRQDWPFHILCALTSVF